MVNEDWEYEAGRERAIIQAELYNKELELWEQLFREGEIIIEKEEYERENNINIDELFEIRSK